MMSPSRTSTPSLDAELAGLLDRLLAPQLDEVVILHHLSPDESLFEIRMDDSGSLWCGAALFDGPGPDLLLSCREIRLELEEVVGRTDQLGHTGLLQPQIGEEHVPLFLSSSPATSAPMAAPISALPFSGHLLDALHVGIVVDRPPPPRGGHRGWACR